jgi:hypothetical protein
MSQKEIVMSKSTTVAAPAAPLFTLNDKASALAAVDAASATLQTPEKGLGREWRKAQYTAPNTRVGALRVLADVVPCTAEAAQAALAKAKAEGLNLGTGTPRSYVVAFVKNGYLTKA